VQGTPSHNARDLSIVTMAVALSSTAFTIDVLVPLGSAVGVLYMLPVLLAIRVSKPWFVWVCAVAGTVLTLAGWALSPSGGEFWPVLTNRALSVFAILTTAVGISLYRKESDHAQEVLAQQREAEARFQQREALANLGELAAVVAHEVRNPLAGLLGGLQVLRNRFPEDSKDVAIIDTMRDRLTSLERSLTSLLRFARAPDLQLEPVELHILARQAMAGLAEDPAMEAVKITLDGTTSPIQLDGDLMGEVLTNVLLNAAQAMDQRGHIAVSVGQASGRCWLEIDDDGTGFEPDALAQAFKPFYTTRIRGTGLGLSVVRRTVNAHGGRVVLGESPLGGARVRVELPDG
jgi:signal transduction histidine kinase